MHLYQNKKDTLLYLLYVFPIILVFSKFLAEILILVILCYLILFNKKVTFQIIKKDFFFKSFLVYICILIILSFFSADILPSLKRSVSYFRFIFFIIFIKYFFLTNEKRFINFLLITSLFLIILSLDIFFQFFNGKDILGHPSASEGKRNSGFFGDEFIAGGYIVLFFFPCLLLSNINKYKNIILFLIIIFPTTIVITGERSSLFLMFLGLILSLPLLIRDKRLSIALISSLILMTLTINFSSNANNRIIQTTISQVTKGFDNKYFQSKEFVKEYDENSKNNKKNRIGFLNSGWGAHILTAVEIWRDYPIYGSGLKTFRKLCSNEKYEKIKSLNFKNRCATHPHQIYFEILSETGVIGFFSIIIIFIIILNRMFKILIVNKKEYSSILVLFTPIIIKLWPLTTTGSFFSNYNLILLSFFIGFVLSLENFDINKLTKFS